MSVGFIHIHSFRKENISPGNCQTCAVVLRLYSRPRFLCLTLRPILWNVHSREDWHYYELWPSCNNLFQCMPTSFMTWSKSMCSKQLLGCVLSRCLSLQAIYLKTQSLSKKLTSLLFNKSAHLPMISLAISLKFQFHLIVWTYFLNRFDFGVCFIGLRLL